MTTIVSGVPGVRAEKLTLANGLVLLTAEMHAAPVVSVFAWYRVGGRHDPVGRTGLSHWVEHMLFKSTRGLAPGAIPRLLYGLGAQWNGFTWFDYTTCFATLPRDGLDVVLRIEAERMAHALVDDAATERERGVLVAERQADEHNPSVILREATHAAVFGGQGYGRPLGGSTADLQAATPDDVLRHYRTWYRPNNAVIVVVGDVDAERVREDVVHYFGGFSEGDLPRRTPESAEPRAGRRVTVRGYALAPLLQVVFPIPAASHPDHLAASLLATLLGAGRRSRLHQALVSNGAAAGVRAVSALAREPHLLTLEAVVRPDADQARVEAVVLNEVQRLADGIPTDELASAKRRLRSVFVLGTEGTNNLARLIGRYEMADSYHRFESYLDEVEAVTSNDIERIARLYVRPDAGTIGWLVPEPSAPPPTASVGATEHLHA